MDKLGSSEQECFHLARAFIFDPEVLIIHKPVDAFDGDLKDRVLRLMREFVDKRGWSLTMQRCTRAALAPSFLAAVLRGLFPGL